MVYVVIPNLNGEDFLDSCVTSLLNQELPPQKIVVVDNGSTDGSLDVLKRFPDQLIHVIPLEKNTGFSGGVNKGIEYSIAKGAEYIVLFNNDAEADKKWLKHLIASAKNSSSDVGFVASKILSKRNGSIDSTGEIYSIWGLPFPRGRGQQNTTEYDSDTEIFAASGGASLFKASFLRDVGFFDQRFFAYYEDVDIGFRGQLYGWKGLFNPEAIVYHEIGGTSGKMSGFVRYHGFKNLVFLYVKNQPLKLFLKYLPLFLVSFLSMNLNMLVKLDFLPLLKGWVSIVINLPGVIVSRRRIQKRKVVSSEYIDSMLSRSIPPTQKTLIKLARVFK